MVARLGAQNINFVVDRTAISIIHKKYLGDFGIAIVSDDGQTIECSGQTTLNLAVHNLKRECI